MRIDAQGTRDMLRHPAVSFRETARGIPAAVAPLTRAPSEALASLREHLGRGTALGAQAPSPSRALLAGLVAGLAGTLAMTLFQRTWLRASRARRRRNEGGERRERSEARDEPRPDERSAPSTVRVAEAGARHVLGRGLLPSERSAAGQLVHLGFGTSMGGLYGLLVEHAPATSAGHGTAFALALMLAADDLALPALGFAPPPQRQPPSSHAYAAAAHAVYGLVTEGVRRSVRAGLG